MRRRPTLTLWSDPDGQNDQDIPPELMPFALRQYRSAWDLYQKAGCPFGETDMGMLLWFTFDRQTQKN